MTLFKVASASLRSALTAWLMFLSIDLLKADAFLGQVESQDESLVLARDQVVLSVYFDTGVEIQWFEEVHTQRNCCPVTQQIYLHAGIAAGVHSH